MRRADSYWIILGLLTCGMRDTARGMVCCANDCSLLFTPPPPPLNRPESGSSPSALLQVRNLLHQLSTFGFIPNGGRLYYLNRSQPPMLSDMVLALMRDQFDLRCACEAALNSNVSTRKVSSLVRPL